MKVVIAGGGIGGLTAALCFQRLGWHVEVYEKSPALSEVGAGIQIPPNAMKVFAELGIDRALMQIGFQPMAIEARMGETGRQLFSIPILEEAERRWGAPYLHIHRADYISVLKQALETHQSDAVRVNSEVKSYRNQNDGVLVQFVDGSDAKCDLLIGADGIHSAIRSQMLGPEAPTFTGNVAWRSVVPIEKLGSVAPRPTVCAWMGRGRHCVTYRLRRGELANFVGVVEREDWTIESWNEVGSVDEALADFEGWHPTITRILEESDALFRWALFDRAPLDKWTDGRVALLGDAAHPMLPFMAQGAAMAVEDAWVLAQQAYGSSDLPSALTAYQHKRHKRTSEMQAGSRANAKTFHKRSALGQISTYGPMWLAGSVRPEIIYARQDALYGHDVTAL